jgi:hypothetical protein
VVEVLAQVVLGHVRKPPYSLPVQPGCLAWAGAAVWGAPLEVCYYWEVVGVENALPVGSSGCAATGPV